MQNKRYFIRTFLISALVIPVLIQLCGILALLMPVVGWVLALVVLVFGIGPLWKRVAGWQDLPDDTLSRYAPIAVSFLWYMLGFVIAFGLAGYQYGDGTLAVWVFIGALPWFLFNFLFSFGGDYTFYPILQILVHGIFAICLAVCCARRGRRAVNRRRGLALLGAAVLVCGVCGFQFYGRSQRILSSDYSVLKVEDEVSLWDYKPFARGNSLQIPLTTPSLAIESEYPRLDGATAAYPVYGAMVQAVYKGLDESTVSEWVSCTGTNQAYQRLMDGEIDIFFGAEPSQQQIDEAAGLGITFHMTPVAREAFVFFVNAENPVDSLTVGQIQDIYQRNITNWRQVGGADESILAFQRPQNSGSQTIMQRIMRGNPLPTPLIEEYAAGMGGVINAVASYRNYQGAIGYSFRFFATGMKPNDDIKLLGVEGVEPSAANIRSGAYPFTVEVYAVTTREPQGNVQALIDWILSPEGQVLIERCGYVGL